MTFTEIVLDTGKEIINDITMSEKQRKEKKKGARLKIWGNCIQGAEKVKIDSDKDLEREFDYAMDNRKTEATALNPKSSRSHMLMTIYLD